MVALSATFQYIVTYCEDIIVTSPFDNVWQESLDAVYSSKTSLITRSGPARFAFPYAYFCTDEACLSHLQDVREFMQRESYDTTHHLYLAQQLAIIYKERLAVGRVWTLESYLLVSAKSGDATTVFLSGVRDAYPDADSLLCKIMFDEHLCEGSDDLLKFYKKKLYTNRADIVKKLVCSKASISIVLQDGGAIVAAHTLARCRTRAGKDLWYTKLLVATRDERRLSKKLDERVYAFFREYSTPVYYRLTQSVGFDYKNFGGKARRQLSRKADLENARGYWTKHMRCDDAASCLAHSSRCVRWSILTPLSCAASARPDCRRCGSRVLARGSQCVGLSTRTLLLHAASARPECRRCGGHVWHTARYVLDGRLGHCFCMQRV